MKKSEKVTVEEKTVEEKKDTVRIKMRTSWVSGEVLLNAGMEYEVSPALAQSLIESGDADKI